MSHQRSFCMAFCLLAFALVSAAFGQDGADPVVARMEMKLTLKEEVIDTIQKGDLLTVLKERDDAFVIQTFNGHKGAVAKTNVAKLPESVPIYDELIKEKPDDGRLYTLRASANWAMADIEAALKDYDKAIELGYDEAHAYTSRGLFHAATGKYDEAIEDYTVAIEKDPTDDVPRINRASVVISTGQYEKAVGDYSAAIELNPNTPVLYSQRAVASKLLGKFEDALKDYDQTLKLNADDVTAILGRGFINFQLGNHQQAIEDFGQVIERSPESAVAYNNRGYNYQQLKRYSEALADYRKATELAPRYLLALQNRAWLLTLCEQEELRDPQLAIETAKAACELSDYKDVSDLTLLAASYASAEEFETAIGWQEKAAELGSAEQKVMFAKILERYHQQKPLDPALLEVTANSSNSENATGANEQNPSNSGATVGSESQE